MNESEMLHRAAAYCSTAERCIQDVEKKIVQSGFSKEISERIITRLLKEKFIDEKRFCQSFVNDKFRFNKWGRIKINYELQKKDIPTSIREEILNTINESEYTSTLIELLKAKKKTTKAKDERDLYYKLVRFAANRGFENKEIQRSLRLLLNTDIDEDSLE